MTVPVSTVPLRAALYLRVSTARQAEHDVSIPDQKRQGEAYCAARGYQFVETYVEPGASVTNDRRPEFQRMIEAGTSKPALFDVVIVHSFIRTGKGGRYRYYACSTKARQGPTGCEGMAVPMEKLDDLVASYLEERLLQPERLEIILASILDRRQEQSERRCEHIAELNKRAAESELRLKRLYDAIEAGVADIDDPALKDRIDGLKVIRNQARANAERAQAMLDASGTKAVTPQMVRIFAKTARQHIRLEGGGYRRDHLRAFAQRVEVTDGEVRIIGSKTRLLQALIGKNSVISVPTQGLKWRRGWEKNAQFADPAHPWPWRASAPVPYGVVCTRMLPRERGEWRLVQLIASIRDERQAIFPFIPFAGSFRLWRSHYLPRHQTPR